MARNLTSANTKTAAEAGLADAFVALRPTLPGGAVAERRESAFRRFAASGLPDRHVEDWKYTDLRTLMRKALPIAAPPDAAAKVRGTRGGAPFADVSARRITVVDGKVVPELSELDKLEPELKIASLAAVLGRGAFPEHFAAPGPAEGDVAYALNTALMGDGAVIDIADGARIERPIHLVFVKGTGAFDAVFSRSLVSLGAGSALTLLESHEGPDGVEYQVNTAIDIVVGKSARLEHIKFNAEGTSALHVATASAKIAGDATYSDLTLTIGGGVVRNQLFVQCAGARSLLALNGASLLKGRQHVDTTLMVDHAAAGCRGRELFKSVLDEQSRGVFQGRIVVRRGAQKTDARMMTRALLLSEDAEADNKPELEIFADDVQCGHGATSGALDDNLKFYLMARGIPEAEAEALLIESFVAEAVEAVTHEGIREALMGATRQWLGARRREA